MRRPQINISLSRQPRQGDNTDNTVTETVNSIDWDRISKCAQETVKTVAVAAVAVYVAKKAVDTTSEIAIIAAQSHFDN